MTQYLSPLPDGHTTLVGNLDLTLDVNSIIILSVEGAGTARVTMDGSEPTITNGFPFATGSYFTHQLARGTRFRLTPNGTTVQYQIARMVER